MIWLSSILSLLAVACAVLLYVVWPKRRAQLLYGVLFSLPILLLQLVNAGSFSRLGTNAFTATLYILTTTFFVVGLGGLVVVMADMIVTRWFTPAVHERRHTLAWLSLGFFVTIISIVAHQSVGLALLLGLTVNAFVLVTLDRALIWDVIVGASAFGFWYVVADLLFGIRASGDIHLFLIGANPIGVTLDGLPAERVLVMAMAGLLLGPLFAATKHRRASDVPKTTSVTRAKMLVGLGITMLGVIGMAWMSAAYVLPPKLTSLNVHSGSPVSLTTRGIVLNFSRPVSRDEISLKVTPNIDGSWIFSRPSLSDHGYRQAQFIFSDPLPAATTYHGTVSDIRSLWGFAGSDVTISFTTEAGPVVITPPEVAPPVPVVVIPVVPVTPVTPTPIPTPTPVTTVAVKKYLLSIPLDYQDSPLSCEAAALKMALAGAGVKVTEAQIMKYVGYDPTPHSGNVWGDPNQAFVGNIAGKQDTTGYGVYWGPIAKAASHWRTARVITNGTPEMLAAEIVAGHAVVVWGTLGNAYRDDWKTPNGKSIMAWKGEHARTLVGIIGTAANPTSFILNDPVVGRMTWTRSQFDANWSRFNRSAVVVE